MELTRTSILARLTADPLRWPELYRQMGMTPRRYLLQIVIPFGLLGLAVPSMVIRYAEFIPLNHLHRTSSIISLFIFCIIPLYPFLWKETMLKRAQQKLPLLLTQMAILSTSGAPAVQVIKRVSEMDEYDPLIATMKWVNMLIKRFHMPGSEALLKVAIQTDNKPIREFLERFAHAVEVGEDPRRFLSNEQDVAMDSFSSDYMGSLSEVEQLKATLASMVTAALFLTTFLMLVPILTGVNVTQLMMFIIVVFFMIEGFNAFVVLGKLPVDEIWYKMDKVASRQFEFPIRKYIQLMVMGGIMLVLVLAHYIIPLDLPLPVKVSLAITPLLLPGIIISIEEGHIKDREENFAPFMRALGRTGAVKGESFIGNLRRLSLHEFGFLTVSIRRLTRRLSTRIKPVNAWRHFSAETGSNLINRYAEMYVQGTEEGGDPREISTLIDINLVTAMELRQDRARLSGGLTGLFYGLMVAISFTLYVNLNMLEMMSQQVASIDLNQDSSAMSYSFLQNMGNLEPMTALLTTMVTTIIFIHAFVSSSIIARLKGGHPATGYVHFVGLLWCGTLTAYITEVAISNLM